MRPVDGDDPAVLGHQMTLQHHEPPPTNEATLMEQKLVRLQSQTQRMSVELKLSKEEHAKMIDKVGEQSDRERALRGEIEALHGHLRDSRARMAEAKRRTSREVHDLKMEKKDRASKLAVAESVAKRHEMLYLAAKRELARVEMERAARAAAKDANHVKDLHAAGDRAAAAEAAATAATALFRLVVGRPCEAQQYISGTSLRDEIFATRCELDASRVEKERFVSQVAELTVAVAQRVGERDAAVCAAQIANRDLEQTRADLRSCKALVRRRSEESGHRLHDVATLTLERDAARAALEQAKSKLSTETEARAKIEHQFALKCEECGAKNAAIAALDQARRDAEGQCDAARRRAAKADIKLIKEQQHMYEIAESKAATALEAIVREKHEMTRQLAEKDRARHRADEVVRLLTERCVFLVSELRSAARAEAAWREERALLRAAVKDAHRELDERGLEAPAKPARAAEDAALEDSSWAAAEQAAVDALRRATSERTRLRLAGTTSDETKSMNNHRSSPWFAIARRSDDRNAAPNGRLSWEVRAADTSDSASVSLIARLDLSGFLVRISDLAGQLVASNHATNREFVCESLEMTLVEKLAELASEIRSVEAASASECASMRADLVAVSAELGRVQELTTSQQQEKAGANVSFEALAKTEVVKRYARETSARAIELSARCDKRTPLRLDLSGLRLDDEACVGAARAILNPEMAAAADAWCGAVTGAAEFHATVERPAVVDAYDKDQSSAVKSLRTAACAPRLRPLSLLARLILRDNAIGDVGATCVARTVVLAAPALVFLDLSHNKVSSHGYAALEQGARSNRTIVHVAVTEEEQANNQNNGKQQRKGVFVVGWRQSVQGGCWDAEAALRLAEDETKGNLYPLDATGAAADSSSSSSSSSPLVVDIRQQNATRPHLGVSLSALMAIAETAPLARVSVPRETEKARARVTASCASTQLRCCHHHHHHHHQNNRAEQLKKDAKKSPPPAKRPSSAPAKSFKQKLQQQRPVNQAPPTDAGERYELAYDQQYAFLRRQRAKTSRTRKRPSSARACTEGGFHWGSGMVSSRSAIGLHGRAADLAHHRSKELVLTSSAQSLHTVMSPHHAAAQSGTVIRCSSVPGQRVVHQPYRVHSPTPWYSAAEPGCTATGGVNKH